MNYPDQVKAAYAIKQQNPELPWDQCMAEAINTPKVEPTAEKIQELQQEINELEHPNPA